MRYDLIVTIPWCYFGSTGGLEDAAWSFESGRSLMNKTRRVMPPASSDQFQWRVRRAPALRFPPPLLAHVVLRGLPVRRAVKSWETSPAVVNVAGRIGDVHLQLPSFGPSFKSAELDPEFFDLVSRWEMILPLLPFFRHFLDSAITLTIRRSHDHHTMHA